MKNLDRLALLLVIIGAVNWGIVAVTGGSDLVTGIFGNNLTDPDVIPVIVFALVGLSGIWTAVRSVKMLSGK